MVFFPLIKIICHFFQVKFLIPSFKAFLSFSIYMEHSLMFSKVACLHCWEFKAPEKSEIHLDDVVFSPNFTGVTDWQKISSQLYYFCVNCTSADSVMNVQPN